MENFFLLGPKIDSQGSRISFIVSSTTHQGINQATEDMIAQMLSDMDIVSSGFSNWSLEHMITNYLADDTEEVNWRDIWKDTWEFFVTLKTPIVLQTKPDMLWRTFAHDITWKEEQDGSRPHLPAPAVLIADFYTQQDANYAEMAFNKFKHLRSSPHSIDVIRKIIPHSSDGFINELNSVLVNLSRNNTLIARARRDIGWPYQILIGIDHVDIDFFENNNVSLEIITDLCYEIGGTTNFDELQSVIRKLHLVAEKFQGNPFSVSDAASIMRLDQTRVARYLQGWSEYSSSGLHRIDNSVGSEVNYKFQTS